MQDAWIVGIGIFLLDIVLLKEAVLILKIFELPTNIYVLLEEARQLQLSMLPKKLPNITGLEIAAYMKPATEIGGDYYDFHEGADGTLTIAVGDAIGHGLKAGSVVTATKSLFNAFAKQDNISQILKEMSQP